MGIVERAYELREAIEGLATNLSDDEALEYSELFAAWATDKNYAVGDRITYNGILYKCLQSHTSQDGWTPEAAPSLWAKVLIPPSGEIPVWEQPDSTNPYMTGDKVHYPTIDDPVYESQIDNNIWSPADYPDGWRVINENDVEPKPPDEPTDGDDTEPPVEDTIPVWEQPTAENPYNTGDKVHYPGADSPVFESLVDGNVWAPDVYPAGWRVIE